jgi:DNA-binding NarL/FixJ family response regulator
MLVPFKKTAVIVDQMAFRRARVESFLEPWAKAENVELISLQPEPAYARLIERGCDILIYDIGSTHPFSCKIFAEFQMLHKLCPRAALVILSDDASPVSVCAALNFGVQGYLSNSMPPDLALHALSFILQGGTYFPPTAVMTRQIISDTLIPELPQSISEDLSREQAPLGTPQRGQLPSPSSEDQSLQPQSLLFDKTASRGQHGDEPSTIHCNSSRLDGSELQLTDRQQAILSCICRGDSNKIIARTFAIAESTVKIHVQSILRKVRVKNRTQAAIWAIQNGFCTASDQSEIPSENLLPSARLN